MHLDTLEHMRATLRHRDFSENTEKAYLYWARAFLLFYEDQPPESLGRNHVEAFLAHLATDRYAATSTQNQALRAVQFLYDDVLHLHPGWLNDFVQERQNSGLPNVLAAREVQRLLSQLHGQDWLIAALIYGSGLRLMECLRLRVRDLDFGKSEILVTHADGSYNRITLLPRRVIDRMREHLESRKLLHIRDIAEGLGEVYLPPEIQREQPGVGRSWAWQYIFPAQLNRTDPESRGVSRRHHVNERRVRQVLDKGAMEAGIFKRISADTLRNSFAVHLIRSGVKLKDVEALLGTAREPEFREESAPPARLHTPSPLDGMTAH